MKKSADKEGWREIVADGGWGCSGLRWAVNCGIAEESEMCQCRMDESGTLRVVLVLMRGGCSLTP